MSRTLLFILTLLTSQSSVADANTISLLSAYVFTPRRYVTFKGGAAEGAWPPSPIPPPNVSPQLRLTFFQTAVGVLLRTQSSPEQDQNTTGRIERYLVMKRLLPLFEQYAPRKITEAMRDQFSALDCKFDREFYRRGRRAGVICVDQRPHSEPARCRFRFYSGRNFSEVANNDFDRALQLARGFREEAPRANATLAICQAVLTKINRE